MFILAALAFGSIWFWLLLALFSVAIITTIEYERSGWATLESLLFAAFVIWCLRAYHPIDWVTSHPLLVVEYVLGWFLAGTVWASSKWIMRSAKIARKYNALRQAWLAAGKVIPATGTRDDTWNNAVIGATGRYLHDLRPNLMKHKEQFMTWMVWWPWSAFWTIINDPVRRIFELIYEGIAGTLQGVSDRMFAGFTELQPEGAVKKTGPGSRND